MQQLDIGNDISIKLTRFFMKCSGFWLAANSSEQKRRDMILYYTVYSVLFAIYVEAADFYYTWGDFSEIIYITCNLVPLFSVLSKVLILSLHRSKFMNLIKFMQNNFWLVNDNFEKMIILNCKDKCLLFVCSFTFFSQGTVLCYVLSPILENIGKNESDRVLPFRMWIDLPFSMSPYFEITFIVQILSLLHVGICYFCFDNLLCIINIYTTGQFRILQHKFTVYSMQHGARNAPCCNVDLKSNYCNLNKFDSGDIYECYNKFKDCIRQHQTLIRYCENVNGIFTYYILGQVLLSSGLLCLSGYQGFVADLPPIRRANFISYGIGATLQLIMFTYSCQILMDQSYNVGPAVYSSPWTYLSAKDIGRTIRKDIQMIIMRVQRPCYLSAGGFFPVSLETYTSVMSTTMSYFTLLRQCSMDIDKD